MLNSIMSSNNMMVSPHWVATQIGIDIMRSGGNAVEAMIASAAAISMSNQIEYLLKSSQIELSSFLEYLSII